MFKAKVIPCDMVNVCCKHVTLRNNQIIQEI